MLSLVGGTFLGMWYNVHFPAEGHFVQLVSIILDGNQGKSSTEGYTVTGFVLNLMAVVMWLCYISVHANSIDRPKI